MMKKENAGFTLIEVLIYSGILAIFLWLSTQIFISIKLSQSHSAAFVSVSKNYRFLISDLTQTIRSATNVTSPVFGNSSATLSLNSGAITYQLEDGVFTKTESGQTLGLTTSDVTISNLFFGNTGSINQPGVIRITMTLSANYLLEGGRTLSQDFQTAISLR